MSGIGWILGFLNSLARARKRFELFLLIFTDSCLQDSKIPRVQESSAPKRGCVVIGSEN